MWMMPLHLHVNQKSDYDDEEIIFTKEGRTIRQKSGCLNHSNERIFHVNADQGFLERGFICIRVVGFALWILSHLS